MKPPLPTREPVGIGAIATGAWIWLQQTYIPDMPVELAASIGAFVAVVARQWVKPLVLHLEEVDQAIAQAKTSTRQQDDPRDQRPSGSKPGVRACIALAVLLGGAATAEAQGIRDPLEQIGRGVAAGAAREAADWLDGGEPDRGQERPPQAMQARPAPAPAPVPEDDGLSADTIVILGGMGMLAAIVLVAVVVLGRRRDGQPAAHLMLGQDAAAEEERAELEAAQEHRFKAARRLLALSFLSALTVQIGEILLETWAPGAEDVLNLIHVLLWGAVALFFALTVVFGPVCRELMPTLTLKMLIWNKEGTIPVQVRVALIYSIFGLVAMTMLVIASYSGG